MERQQWVDKDNLYSSVVQIEFLLENNSLNSLLEISDPLPTQFKLVHTANRACMKNMRDFL